MKPSQWWKRSLLAIYHKGSILPANGVSTLISLAQDKKYDFFLITARYREYEKDLDNWLDKYKLKPVFSEIKTNIHNEQPHLFKEKLINELALDYFIEDNLDIAQYLAERSKAKILWIKNIFDEHVNFGEKYAYLKEALEKIVDENSH